jgi:hypothetical protein
MGAFFASQKTGLSAPIPRPAYGGPAGFPLQSLARKKRQATSAFSALEQQAHI